MNPLVSLTIATYNVEKYIEESFKSLLSQSFDNLEIICIDDASSDKTPTMLEKFAENDKRVKLIVKKQNEGLAVARNEALDLAKGKYVAFLDGDDLYEMSLFEKAVSVAEKEQSDVVVWDYCTFYKESELDELKKQPSDLKRVETTDNVAFLQRPAFTWVKLFRTDFLRELGVKFPFGLTRQDIPVHWHVFTSDAKVSILPERLSFYRQQPGATTAQKGRKLLDIAQIQLEVKKVLDEVGLYHQFKNTYLEQQLNMLHGMYDNVKPEFKREALSLINDQLGEPQTEYINSSKPMRRQARWFYKDLQGSFIDGLCLRFWMLSRALYRSCKSLVSK